ncbi:MAG: hypothetical protein JKY70_16845 [Mucilaginibacter sp.]|nr:hypothetical protein [Mucilaginibacter sp.]
MRKRLTLSVISFSLIACSQKKQIIFPPPIFGFDVPDFIELCEVPKHKNELVYTRLFYSGVDEYWNVHPDKKCDFTNAELDIPENFDLSKRDLKMFKDVHDNYWNRYLIIDAIGTYQTGRASGYGHLGHNKANFVVKNILNIQEVIVHSKNK